MLAGCADGGDAVSLLQVSAARVEVGKNGLTADGRIPSIEVESDGYWRVFAESSAAWVRTDPSAASGSCTVTLSVEANDGPARTAVLRIGCGDGTTQEVEVRQEGAGSRLRYYEDSFGAGADEAVAPSDYEDFRIAGCGALETVYGAERATVAADAPSTGYEGASGGGNIVLAAGGLFTLGPVDVKGALDLRFSTGLYLPSAEAAGSVRLQASRNATQWIDVPFAVAPEAGWSCPMTAFYIAEDVTQLWFRLSTGADGVRIDDPALVEGEEAEGELLELGGELAAPEGLECAIAERSLTFSWDAVRNAKSYDYELYTKQGVRVAEGSTPLTTAAVEGLEMGTTYRFSVRAVPAEGTIYSASEAAELEATTVGLLPDPEVRLLRKTHGMLVFEWMKDPYTTTYGRRYNFVLVDRDSVVVRQQSRVNYASNATYNLSYVYNRQAFGGLQPSTDYRFYVQYVSDSEQYRDSNWVCCEATTDPRPQLPIGCLLYKDFEEAWFGGSAIDVAWGQHPSGNQLDLDYDAEESIELYVVYPIRCMEDSFNTAKLPEQYRRKYWSGWDWSDIGEKDIAKKSNTGLFLICGAVKFGSGSAYGRMTTPALGQYGLSGVSDIVVSFKACPYTEPNLTTGNLMVSPYILCGATFNISIWAGAGTFENGSTEMTLTNLTPDQTDAQGNGHYSWTEHSVRIKGADSHTRVSISTVAQKGYYRMWFDDLMIVRDDGGQSEGSSGSGSGGDYGDGGDGFDTEGSASSGGSAGGGSYGDGGDGFDTGGTPGGSASGGDYGNGGDGF